MNQFRTGHRESGGQVVTPQTPNTVAVPSEFLLNLLNPEQLKQIALEAITNSGSLPSIGGKDSSLKNPDLLYEDDVKFRPRGNSFQYDFEHPRTKLRTRMSVKCSDPAVGLAEVLRVINAPKEGMPLDLFVKEFVSDCVCTWFNEKNKKSAETLFKKLVEFFPGYRLPEITKADLLRFRSSLRKSAKKGKVNSNASVNRRFADVRNLINEAFNREFIDKNPVATIENLKASSRPSRTANDLQLRELFVRASKHCGDYVVTASFTGLRDGVLCQLTDKNFTFDGEFYWLDTEGIKTKNNKAQKIPVHPSIVPMLKERAAKGGKLFPPLKDGKRYHHKREWTRLRKELGLEGVTFHGLRRTFITILAEQGVPIHVVQRLASHSKIEQTRAYIDSDRSEKRALVEATNSLSRIDMFAQLEDRRAS